MVRRAEGHKEGWMDRRMNGIIERQMEGWTGQDR